MSQPSEIRRLLDARKTAALGTLHLGAPYVSMVPFVWHAAAEGFVIHVSKLAAHTNDMLADPRVSLLITAAEDAKTPPQALPRLTIQGQAKPIATGTETHGSAKRAYLERFPQAAPIFQLGDFSLFVISPGTIRHIAGFGQAQTLTCETLREIMG